jgi:RNA polymerase sigma-70 factor (ECF subfamily)
VPAPAARRPVASTRWSIVQAAAGRDEASRLALDVLFRAYWYPLYAFARRRGASSEDAQDLVQGFFVELMEKVTLARADPERGRFRAYLMTAFGNFQAKDHARRQTLKRGGGHTRLSLDFEDGENRYRLEPSGGLEADRLFERRFALVLIDRALDVVAGGYRSSTAEKAERFEALRPFLEGAADTPSYRVVGARLGLSETAVKVAVHRLRARFRDALRAEVADTLTDPRDVDAEIRHLQEVLGTS